MPFNRNPVRMVEYDEACENNFLMWRIPDEHIQDDSYGMFCAPACSGAFEASPDGTGNSVTFSCHAKKKNGKRGVRRGTAQYMVVASRATPHTFGRGGSVTVLPS